MSDSATPQTVAHQALLSMGFPRQEYQSKLPLPPLRDLPNPGIKPMFLEPPASVGRFFTMEPPEKPWKYWRAGSREKIPEENYLEIQDSLLYCQGLSFISWWVSSQLLLTLCPQTFHSLSESHPSFGGRAQPHPLKTWHVFLRQIYVCMYTYGWLMLRFDRKQQTSVKQLSFN